MSNITEKVIEYLKWHPSAKPADIANYLGVNIKLIRAILIRLRQRGIVVKSEKGYSLRPGANIETELENITQESFSLRIHGTRESPGVSKGNTEITSDSRKSISESAIIAGDGSSIGVATPSTYELNNRISVIEKRILEIENMLNNVISKIEGIIKNQANNLDRGIDRDNREFLDLYAEALEIIKMCLQAILTNDATALNSLINELEYIIDRIKQRLNPKH